MREHSHIMSDYARRKAAKESAAYRQQLKNERLSEWLCLGMAVLVALVASGPYIMLAIR